MWRRILSCPPSRSPPRSSRLLSGRTPNLSASLLFTSLLSNLPTSLHMTRAYPRCRWRYRAALLRSRATPDMPPTPPPSSPPRPPCNLSCCAPTPDLAGRVAIQGDITDDSTVSALLPSLPLTLQRCPPCPSHGVTARSVSGLAPASTS